MKMIYFDCFSGISGDMLLGSFIDLGVEATYLTNELKKLHLNGYQMVYSRKKTGGITGSDVDVQLDKPNHDSHHHHRNLSDCTAIIQNSSLSSWVKEQASQVFAEVACVEGHVHGLPMNEVHFHEVGAVDSIIDIVGAFICLERLGIKKVYASPLHDGHGFITCAHGRMPVPVPAVAQMLASSGRKIPYIQEDIPTELVTPTGLAIIKTIATNFQWLPDMHIQKIGYGTGKRDTGKINALRAVLGEQADSPEQDEVVLLEANIDNQAGELLGFALKRCMSEGALDAFFTPIYMKKNRPAVKFSVIAKLADEQKMAALILTETATLGVRVFHCPRYMMHRELLSVRTPYGQVHVKHATMDRVEKWAPEFNDCAKLALAQQLPLPVIYQAAQQCIDSSNKTDKLGRDK